MIASIEITYSNESITPLNYTFLCWGILFECIDRATDAPFYVEVCPHFTDMYYTVKRGFNITINVFFRSNEANKKVLSCLIQHLS